VLRPRLEAAEREMGRRSVLASMLAGVLAAALHLGESTDAAMAVLADRLDVIERAGFSDSLLLAYRVLVEVGIRNGDERRALDALQSLHEIGVARASRGCRWQASSARLESMLLAQGSRRPPTSSPACARCGRRSSSRSSGHS